MFQTIMLSNYIHRSDPWAETQPVLSTRRKPAQFQPSPPPPTWMKPSRKRRGCGCGSFFVFLLIVATAFAVFFMAPIRTNIVFMGIDYVPEGSYVARSDTIMLASIVPLKPHVGLLSIPRDLWVVIPDIGENRINTAHFFAEANSAGSGPIKLMETVRANFGVEMDYYVRIKFEGVREIVNAMGGVDIELTEPMAGYPAGVHHLTGNKALAFARHRLGADDFFRMEQGQILLLGILKQSLKPQNWIHLPRIVFTTLRAIDTDLPWWQWLRLGLAILRAGPEGIGHTIIGREMVASYTTDQGANVLLPDWQKINEIVKITFGN